MIEKVRTVHGDGLAVGAGLQMCSDASVSWLRLSKSCCKRPLQLDVHQYQPSKGR